LISGMGLIFVLLLKEKITWLHASLAGLIFFISSQTYPAALLLLTFWFLLILLFKLIKSRHVGNLKGYFFSIFSITNATLFIAFLIPILFSLPYFVSFYRTNIASAATQISNPTLNSISQTSSEIVRTNISFNWIFDIPALWLFFSEFGKLLAIASFSLILLSVFFVLRVKGKLGLALDSVGTGLFLVYIFVLMILGYLALTLFLPIHFLSNLFDPQRVWQHLFVPASMMSAVVIFSTIYLGFLTFRRLFGGHKTKLRLGNDKFLAGVLLALLLIFTASLVSAPVITEQERAYGKIGLAFNDYETLKQTDLLLMKWITENVPSQAHILISSGDSGQFVASVTQRQTIFRYSNLKNYGDLMGILTFNASDPLAIPLLMEYNVSYVYIGSTATNYATQSPSYRHFNATQFLSTPYFILEKEYGDAWLFQFNASAALDTFNNYA